MRKFKVSKELKENMSELADVENKDLGVVDNVYAAAIRDFRKTKKQKEDAVKVQDAEKLDETPKKPEMNKGAKQMKLEKLMLEESLFTEDADETKTLIGQILEFPNGDYLTIDFKDGKLIAGNATNAGVIPEFEMEYDNDFSADWNLQVFYDEIIEQKPELLGEEDGALDSSMSEEDLKKKSCKKESIKTRKGVRKIQGLKEEGDRRQSAETKFKRADAVRRKYRNSLSADELEKQSKDANSKLGKLTANVDKTIPDLKRERESKLAKNIYQPTEENLKEDYEKETLENCKDGFGNEIKVGDTVVGIDYYKDITIGKIVDITKEYGDITMVNFDDGKSPFTHGLINTAVYKFDKKYGYIYGYKDSKLKPTLTNRREDISNDFESFSEWSADMYGQGGEKVFKAFDENGEILFDELSEKLEESKQLNEGAGAGYTIEGELYNIVVNKINSIEIHDDKTAFGSPAQFAKIDLDADALFDGSANSYYYGDRIDDAKVKITSLDVNPNLIYDLGLKEFEYDKIELQDLNDRLGFGSTLKFKSDVIGGGWSHLPFDGKAKSTRVDDDYMSYVDGIEFEFVEPYDVEFIDKAVQGETEIEETDIEGE